MGHAPLFRRAPSPTKLVACGVCHSSVQRQFTRKLPTGIRECRECQARYAAMAEAWKQGNRGNRRQRRAELRRAAR